MVELGNGLVVRDKLKAGNWRVYWRGDLMKRSFTSRHAAIGYLTGLRSGLQRGEAVQPPEFKEWKGGGKVRRA
jgi:hypothetical protein